MIIVMTGGTSGIGAEALNNFVKTSNNKVYVGARGSGRSVTDGASLLPLNLSSLKSVRAFAENIKEILGNNKIDSLVLNAGIQASDGKTLSEDGFELTFATNHLAHYLLVNLLLPNVSDEGRIIITTSDAHDPEVVFFGPKTLNPKTLARPDNGRSTGMKLYAETKLCNLLMARSLQKLMVDQKKDITVVAYNPGLTGNTSLMGQQSAFMKILFRVIFRPLFYIISIFKPQFYMGTAQRSGEVLAQLGLGKIKLPFGKIYASLARGKVTFPSISKLAEDDEIRDLLWTESAKLVKINGEKIFRNGDPNK